ncbi:MAG TPA: AI-2E family transporter [Beijerinckiaceae bacterium]|jgi:predicted PurR-regulated permease PerM
MPETGPAAAPRNEVQPVEAPGLRGLLTLATAVVVVTALAVGKDIFIPIVLAMLLGFVLAPLVDLLRRTGIGRVPAVVAAVLLAITIIGALAGLIGMQAAELGQDLPRYQTTVREKVSGLRETAIGRLPELVKSFGREMEKATDEKPAPGQSAPPAPPAEPEPRPLPVEVHAPDPTPLQLAQRFLVPLVKPLATTGIVLVVVIFILLQREDLRDRMIRLFGSRDLHKTTVAMDDAARRLSRYFLIQLGLNFGFGVLIALGLWAIGVPSPILWGIVTALMRFVPYIGSIVSAVLPAALAAAVDPGWTMLLWTVALFAITEPLMGHVVEPLVYGQSTGLSPFAVVVSAIFWTWLWGPIGLLLATPLTLCLVVLGRHVERLEFFDVLLGDRPALSPAENFYQRMLAGDPDEAEEYAEQLLKERSLSSYYDEVALKGLQLAANDAKRGVLSEGRLERIKDAIKGIVSDLSSYEDVEPAASGGGSAAGPKPAEKGMGKEPPVATPVPPAETLPPQWRHGNAILCIAGRGPLDEAASGMLAQLLQKHGLGSRVLPHDAVSRAHIGGLDDEGVAMVCISYLEISGSPAHLRYLIRRLKQRLPGAPILVGLWPAEDAVLSDPSLRQFIGADYYVSSLREGLQACLEAAQKASDGEGEAKAEIVAERERSAERVNLPA